MPGTVFLSGDRVDLRTIEEEDLDFLARHRNDPAVRRGFGWAEPYNEPRMEDFFEEHVADEEGVNLLACRDGEPVGETFLIHVEEGHGRCEIGYWIAPSHRREGYATGAAELLVEYAFAERRFHKVIARALAWNEGSKRVLESVGFEREGRLAEEFYVDGEYVDADLYGVTAAEWFEDD